MFPDIRRPTTFSFVTILGTLMLTQALLSPAKAVIRSVATDVGRDNFGTGRLEQAALEMNPISRQAGSGLRVVSFNMHGKTENIPKFREYLQGEHVICLQEVNDIAETRSQYRDYPYVYTSTNNMGAPPVGGGHTTSLMILSKVPFAESLEKTIQNDPSGHEWERHAQHVILKVDQSQSVDLFHYHNTFHEGDSGPEEEGLRKFVAWVTSTLEIGNLGEARNLVLAGDFNLLRNEGALDLLEGVTCKVNWRDYVCGSMEMLNSGFYDTSNTISDHNAVWAVFDTTINIPAVVGPEVTIYNIKQGEYLYAGDYMLFDDTRRRVFTWRRGNTIKQGYWRLEPVSPGVVRIFNTYQLEYIYAATYAPFDADRRRVFTWRPGSHVAEGYWRIEEKGDRGSRIFNIKHAEYLYAGDYEPFDEDRRRVFTWRPGNTVTEGYWKIEAKA